MNRGYRLSNAVALANYYSDVRNMAEFAARPEGPGSAIVIDPRSRYGSSSAAEIASNASSQRAAINDPFRGVRRGVGRAGSRAAYAAGQGVAGAGRAIGGAAQSAGYLARRNPLAAGAIGLAGAAGLGYGAYRATRPEDEQY